MKPVQGLLWAKEYNLLKIIPIGVEAEITMTHQLIDPLPSPAGLLLEPLHHRGLDSSSNPNRKSF
jgi:hypothetical protein